MIETTKAPNGTDLVLCNICSRSDCEQMASTADKLDLCLQQLTHLIYACRVAENKANVDVSFNLLVTVKDTGNEPGQKLLSALKYELLLL